MSASAILSALAPSPRPGPAPQADADHGMPEDASFSRLLAGQRLADAAETPSRAADALLAAAPPDGEGAADEPALDTPDLPDFALAAQALDIAAQAAAQLRGAELRARGLERTDGSVPGSRAPRAEPAGSPVAGQAEAAAAAETRPVRAAALAEAGQPARAAAAPFQSAVPPADLSAPAARQAGAPAQPAAAHLRTDGPARLAQQDALRSPGARANAVANAVEPAASQPAAAPFSVTDGVDRTHARHAAPAAAGAELPLAAAGLPGEAGARPAALPEARPQIAVPVASPQWGAELGRQVVKLGQNADGTGHTAELRLDPPELGPLRVTLSLTDGVAHASFVSPHASVRHAVESAMAQLQSALAQAGISLGQASVSDQGAQQEFAFGQQPGGARAGESDAQAGSAGLDGTLAPTRISRPDALVDTFA